MKNNILTNAYYKKNVIYFKILIFWHCVKKVA